MAETLSTLDYPEIPDLTPEDIEEITRLSNRVDVYLDSYAANPYEDLRPLLVEDLAKSAAKDPKEFLAQRNLLSDSNEQESPSDSDLIKEGVLRDSLDGMMAIRQTGVAESFKDPSPEVRKAVSDTLERVHYQEANQKSIDQDTANKNAILGRSLKHAQSMLRAHGSADVKDEEQIAIYTESVRNLQRQLDLANGNTEQSDKAIASIEGYIEKIREKNPGIPDDHPRMKAAFAARDAAIERRMKTMLAVGRAAENNPRTKLARILRENPEGIDAVEDYYKRYKGHTVSKRHVASYTKKEKDVAKAQEDLLKANEFGDEGAVALAELKLWRTREELKTARSHREADTKNAELYKQLLEEHDAAAVARRNLESRFGTIDDLSNEAIAGLTNWKYETSKPQAEHGAYKGIKKIEAYVRTIDEQLADKSPSDRDWTALTEMRYDAQALYLRTQYIKAQVRTEVFAADGDTEGRYRFAHLGGSKEAIANRGILVERSDDPADSIVIYPDETYSTITDGVISPNRVDAWGNIVEGPAYTPIEDPRAWVRPELQEHWKTLNIAQLKGQEAVYYDRWFKEQEDPGKRAHLEVLNGIARERIAAESPEDAPLAMEMAYTQHYLALGRSDEGLRDDGAIETKGATFHGVTGDWILRPNGSAEINGATFFGETGSWIIHIDGSGDLYGVPTAEELADEDFDESVYMRPIARFAADGSRIVEGADGEPDEPEGPDDGESEPDEPEEPEEPGGSGPVPPTPPAPPIPPAGGPTPPTGPSPDAPSVTVSPSVAGPESEPEAEPAVTAPSAPTPPKPPTPEAETTDVFEARRKRREALQNAVRAAKGQTIISAAFDTSKGEVVVRNDDGDVAVSGDSHGSIVFADGSNRFTYYRSKDIWTVDQHKRLGISDENLYVAPVTMLEQVTSPDGVMTMEDHPVEIENEKGELEQALRLHYTYEVPDQPRLVVDTELPQSAAAELLKAISEEPKVVRDYVRDLFVQNVVNGEEVWEERGSKPAYDSLPYNWEMSLVVTDPKNPENLLVTNVPVKR